MKDILTFIDEDGLEVKFEILEETRINNTSYILVAEDGDEEETTVYIMKDTSDAEDEEASYEIVYDEEEADSLLKIFDELLGDEMDIRK